MSKKWSELLCRLSTKIQFRHKIVLIICLTLSVYTIISSETISLLIGFNRLYNKNERHLPNSNCNYERRLRGFRTTDRNGNLLYYHLPNLTDYHIIYYYKPYKPINRGLNDRTSAENDYCFTSGTDWNRTQHQQLLSTDTTGQQSAQCVCTDGYSGADCGVPSIVYKSIEELNNKLNAKPVLFKRLSKPKRLVLSVILYTPVDDYSVLNSSTTSSTQLLLNFINETFNSLSDVIDLFIITEIKLKTFDNELKRKMRTKINLKSDKLLNNCLNTSATNCRNSSITVGLKDMLQSDVNRYSDIVLYNSVNISAKQLSGIGANGIHLYILSQVWRTCVERVTDFRPNDILFYMSLNTFPLKQIVLFLKHYTGFPEPIKLISYTPPESKESGRRRPDRQLSDSVVANNNSLVNIGLTFEYLSLLCRYDFRLFANNLCIDNAINVRKFNTTYWPIRYWTVGHYRNQSSANFFLPSL